MEKDKVQGKQANKPLACRLITQSHNHDSQVIMKHLGRLMILQVQLLSTTSGETWGCAQDTTKLQPGMKSPNCDPFLNL